MQKGRSWLENRIVLELGSGTGLVGLVAGALGAQVYITDQMFAIHPLYYLCLNRPTSSPLLEIMHTNVEMNKLTSSVAVAELNWSAWPSIVL